MPDRAPEEPEGRRSDWHSQVTDVYGDPFITGVQLDRHAHRREARRRRARASSSRSATSRNTQFLKGQITTDESGYIVLPDRAQHVHQRRGRLRRRRRRRQGLPPGRHRRRHRLHGRARRRALAGCAGDRLTRRSRGHANVRFSPDASARVAAPACGSFARDRILQRFRHRRAEPGARSHTISSGANRRARSLRSEREDPAVLDGRRSRARPGRPGRSSESGSGRRRPRAGSCPCRPATVRA